MIRGVKSNNVDFVAELGRPPTGRYSRRRQLKTMPRKKRPNFRSHKGNLMVH